MKFRNISTLGLDLTQNWDGINLQCCVPALLDPRHRSATGDPGDVLFSQYAGCPRWVVLCSACLTTVLLCWQLRVAVWLLRLPSELRCNQRARLTLPPARLRSLGLVRGHWPWRCRSYQRSASGWSQGHRGGWNLLTRQRAECPGKLPVGCYFGQRPVGSYCGQRDERLRTS